MSSAEVAPTGLLAGDSATVEGLGAPPDGPVASVRERPVRLPGRGKRVLDVVAALSLLVVVAPVMLLLALAVASTSRGPVIFRQERVGRGGRPIVVYKFRSMISGAERLLPDLADHNDAAGPLFKLHDDPRITRVGKWMRRYSLDELPQLFNVLGGSMSLVGPRPALRAEVERYSSQEQRRLWAKPGMTGLWQISGRSDLGWDEGISLDLEYVEQCSLRLDLRILLLTLPAVLGTRGAY